MPMPVGPIDEETVLAHGSRIVGARDGRVMLTPLPDARSTLVLTDIVMIIACLLAVNTVVDAMAAGSTA